MNARRSGNAGGGEALTAEQLQAAQHFARTAAGDDDVAYLQLLTAAYNAAFWVGQADGQDRRDIAGALMHQTSFPPTPSKVRQIAAEIGKRVYDDPTFCANELLVVDSSTRIIGGAETEDFPDCVAVGNEEQYCCTGTLIAPAVVLTAGHCVVGGCAKRIFLGSDVDATGRSVAVRKAFTHDDYHPDSSDRPYDDLGVLLLAEPVRGVTPRRIASLESLSRARTTRLVGYGSTDFWGNGGYGRRRMVDVGMASDDAAYGARIATEFVAGKPFLDRDSCNGDSGGPAYVDVGGSWELGGAVSRATRLSKRACGDGGIYTRVGAYLDWLAETAGIGG